MLSLLWAIAQLTPTKTDDKWVKRARRLWAMVPIGEKRFENMGKDNPGKRDGKIVKALRKVIWGLSK